MLLSPSPVSAVPALPTEFNVLESACSQRQLCLCTSKPSPQGCGVLGHVHAASSTAACNGIIPFSEASYMSLKERLS